MRRSVVLPAFLRRRALLVAVGVLAMLLLTLLPRAGASTGAEAVVGPPAPSARTRTGPVQTAPVGVADGVVRLTRSYGAAGDEHTYDVFLPSDRPVQARPTVLFLHGGSWEIGDKVEYHQEAVEVAQRGWTAVTVNYRRTPTAPWPAPLTDVRRALADLQRAAPRLGVDVQRIGALGDSVGAQLGALLGRPTPGLVPVRAVVSWSGVNDLPGLLQQPNSGGCPQRPCAYTGLARKALHSLMGCPPDDCPDAWREASPAARLLTGPATFAVNSETELVDPRQAWVMDAALSRARVASRVRVLPGGVHGRGYQAAVWRDSLRFLAAALTPETAPAFPRPAVRVTATNPRTVTVAPGRTLRLTGAVVPRATGSSAAVQQQSPGGAWHTVGLAPLRGTSAGTVYDVSLPPPRADRTRWRVLWRGGGGSGASPVTTVVAS